MSAKQTSIKIESEPILHAEIQVSYACKLPATRYAKTVESFLDFIDMTSIRLRLRHMST